MQCIILPIQIISREKAYYTAQQWRKSIVFNFLLKFPKGPKAIFTFEFYEFMSMRFRCKINSFSVGLL